jgi:hypothetical protein
MPEEKIPTRDERYAQEGWTKKFTCDADRVDEFVEMYESIGFEVRVEPVSPDDPDLTCQACFVGNREEYKTIYTRRIGKKGLRTED